MAWVSLFQALSAAHTRGGEAAERRLWAQLGACLSNRRILLAKEARVRFCPWA